MKNRVQLSEARTTREMATSLLIGEQKRRSIKMGLLPANSSEEFVYNICRKSFLSLWCYNNPLGKDGDELCDVLVVCEPHIVIISVKDVRFKEEKDPEVESQRWQRKAIDASIKQIKGAQRWLTSANHVICADGKVGVRLPPISERRIHRIAVAYGGNGEAVIGSRESEAGFVHVMEEMAFTNILSELDTITDFVDYFAAKEASVADGCKKLVMGPESNLLALYLLNGRSFPSGKRLLVVDDTFWSHLCEMDDYRKMKDLDQVSYGWDRMIETMSGKGYHSLADSEPKQLGLELALRAMARETRFSRRLLGHAAGEFLEQKTQFDHRARKVRGLSGVSYVFIALKPGLDGDTLAKLVRMNCVLTRYEAGSGNFVIGILFIGESLESNFTCQLVYFDTTNWTKADDEAAAKLATLRSPTVTRSTSEMIEMEYFGKKRQS